MAQDDPIKVDLDKESSKNFEIKTMADDLAGPSITPKEPVSLPSATPTAPPSPPQPLSSSDAPMDIPTAPLNSSASFTPPPPNLPPDMMPEEESGGGWLRSFLIGFIVVLLLGIIGIGGWWWYGSRLTGITPTPATGPTPPPTTNTVALLSVDKTISVPLEDADMTQAAFFKKLVTAIDNAKTGLAHDSIVNLDVTQGSKTLPLQDLGKLAGVDVSKYVQSQNYQLVLSVPEQDPVLGLVVPLSDSQTTQNALLADESNLPTLTNQVYAAYTKTALPQGASPTFLENTFQQVTIRYMNFPLPDRSLDYAITDNLLLVAGSRAMVFQLINREKLQSGSHTTPPSLLPTQSTSPTTIQPSPSSSPTTP